MYKHQQNRKLALYSHIQTYPILTNDDQMLILGLYYLINTVSPQFWFWPQAHLRGLTNYYRKYIFDGWTYFIANISRISFCLLKMPKSRSYYIHRASWVLSAIVRKKMFFLINAIQLDWSLAHFSFVFSFGTRPGRFDIAKMHQGPSYITSAKGLGGWIQKMTIFADVQNCIYWSICWISKIPNTNTKY